MQQFSTPETWGILALVGLIGAAGSLAHRAATDSDADAWWRSALVGVVAAIGVAAFGTPENATAMVGTSALAGFFARSLVAALEARVRLEITRQQVDRALRLASDALDLSRRSRPVAATDLDIGRLSARLDEVKYRGTPRATGSP